MQGEDTRLASGSISAEEVLLLMVAQAGDQQTDERLPGNPA